MTLSQKTFAVAGSFLACFISFFLASLNPLNLNPPPLGNPNHFFVVIANVTWLFFWLIGFILTGPILQGKNTKTVFANLRGAWVLIIGAAFFRYMLIAIAAAQPIPTSLP